MLSLAHTHHLFALLILTVLPFSHCDSTTATTASSPSGAATVGPSYGIQDSLPNGNVSAQNRIGTILIGYDGCNKAQVSAINEAYYDAWTISNLGGVSSNINWNEAPALEYLGPPGLNSVEQPQIQAILANMATVIYSLKNPFQHLLHVRCDDPNRKCTCGPNNQASNCNAYSLNSGRDGYPMINFCCPQFFNLPSLANALASGKGQASPENLKLINYNNRAVTFFHDLTHLDLAADTGPNMGGNPRVEDLLLDIKYWDVNGGVDGLGGWEIAREGAYGARRSKILARFQTDTGYYVRRNADNLAFFALAKMVMSKNGNVYPHLPVIVNEELDLPPDMPARSDSESIITFADDNDNGLWLNISSPALSAFLASSPNITDSSAYTDDGDQTNVTVVTIDGLAPLSAYPTDYVASRSQWLSDIAAVLVTQSAGTSDSPPAPTASASASPVTPDPATPISLAPIASDVCGVWYKLLYDNFEIYGKDFDKSKFNIDGTDGSGLKKQIQGCGDLTSWSFKFLTNDPGHMQWYASGKIPIGTKACVGRAVVSAGGGSANGCTGAG